MKEEVELVRRGLPSPLSGRDELKEAVELARPSSEDCSTAKISQTCCDEEDAVLCDEKDGGVVVSAGVVAGRLAAAQWCACREDVSGAIALILPASIAASH